MHGSGVAEDGATECADVFEELGGISAAIVGVAALGAAVAGGDIATNAAPVVAMAEKIRLLRSRAVAILVGFGFLRLVVSPVARSNEGLVHREIKTKVITIQPQDFDFIRSMKASIGHVEIVKRSINARARN